MKEALHREAICTIGQSVFVRGIEETARLHPLLRGAKTRYLTAAQVRELQE
jgi:hypothetical protein